MKKSLKWIIVLFLIILNSSCSLFYKSPVHYKNVKIKFSDRVYAWRYNIKVIGVVIPSDSATNENLEKLKMYFYKRYEHSKREVDVYVYKFSKDVFIERSNSVKFNDSFLDSISDEYYDEIMSRVLIMRYIINENKYRVVD